MENYEPTISFGEDAAEVYDDSSERGDELATVAFLEDLASGGPVLELAVGTGRIALPLRSGAFGLTASISRRRWLPSCAPNRVVRRCR